MGRNGWELEGNIKILKIFEIVVFSVDDLRK